MAQDTARLVETVAYGMQTAYNSGMRPIKLDLSDLALPRHLADILRRVYQHETCPVVLRTFIRFEMGKWLGDRYDMREFLNSKEYEPTE